MATKIALDIGEIFKIGSDPIKHKTGYKHIGEFLSTIINNIYVLAGLILFFLLIGGGISIITSGDDPQKKDQGTKAVSSAITGFFIIFASYWIIQLIEEIAGVDILKFTSPVN